MTTITTPNWTYSRDQASKPLLHKHYRNRLPIHCSVEHAIKMAEDITNGNFSMRKLKVKNVRDMAYVLKAFVQQREDL